MCKFNVYDVRDAVKLYTNDDYEGALKLFLAIQKELEQLKQDSSFVWYYIAICYDMMRDPFEAAYWIIKAQKIDPYNHFVEDSMGIIFNNIIQQMDQLVSTGGSDSEVQRIYDFVKEHGRVTSAAQFIYIRHLVKKKKYDIARPLIEVELERNPNDPDLNRWIKKCQMKLVAQK